MKLKKIKNKKKIEGKAHIKGSLFLSLKVRLRSTYFAETENFLLKVL